MKEEAQKTVLDNLLTSKDEADPIDMFVGGLGRKSPQKITERKNQNLCSSTPGESLSEKA